MACSPYHSPPNHAENPGSQELCPESVLMHEPVQEEVSWMGERIRVAIKTSRPEHEAVISGEEEHGSWKRNSRWEVRAREVYRIYRRVIRYQAAFSGCRNTPLTSAPPVN